ncbi:MAG: DUF2029 domain-containing protein [Chloroflexi bacterium]|nr:DUF2029 domain-containing protein [Chloroflexota bacterium]
MTPPTAADARSRATADFSAPQRPSWLVVGLYLLGAAISVQLVWSSLVPLYGKKGTDYLVVYEASRSLIEGGRLYDLQKISRDLFGANYHLPPFAAMIAEPLAFLGDDQALTAWRVLALASHFGALALLLRVLGVSRWSPLAPAALAVWAFCWPARFTFIHGQWDAFFLLVLAAGLWAEHRKQGVIAGALIAIASSVKPYPGLAMGYFLTRRRWSAVLAAIVAAGLCAGLAYLVAGPQQTTTFVQRVAPMVGATTGYVENQSLTGFVARLLEPEARPVPTELPLVYTVGRLLLVALLAPLVLLGLRTPRDRPAADLQYAAWVATAPIVIPVAWMHYQELLLLPLLVLAANWAATSAPRPARVEYVLFAVGLVLVAFGDNYTVLGAETASEMFKNEQARVNAANARVLADFAGPAVLILSYKLYGALLIWALSLRAAWRASAFEGRFAPWRRLPTARQQTSRPLTGER